MTGLIFGGVFAVVAAAVVFVILYRLGKRERQQHEAQAQQRESQHSADSGKDL